MITLHESNITSFPVDNGIGVLSDAIKATATEELNGMFEFYMEYDSEGSLVDELKKERIIKAKAQDKLGHQLFRIYSVTKNHDNDNLIINAQHITYDLSNNFVEELDAPNMTKKQVMEAIGSHTVESHSFNLTSSNVTTRSSTKLYRTNPLQMVAGMQGSVLQVWGGQIERDNFNLIMHDRRGHDDGVGVTYEKNITGLEATFDISSLVTRIFPFVFIEATDDSPERLITVSGKYIDSERINDYEKIYIEPIDYSHDDRIDIQDKTDAQIRSQLQSVASEYYVETNNDKPKVTFNVAFAHLWETEEYKNVKVLELVGMGDTVTIGHSKLKVDATAIVNYIRYDCIAEINEEVKLGSVKARFSDSINKIDNIEKKVEQAESTVNKVLIAVDGKTKIFHGPDEPTHGMLPGDFWFKEVDGDVHRTYRYDGVEWQSIIDADSQEAKVEAQQARNKAEESVAIANNATQNAMDAIDQAQTAFDEAQTALTTAQGLTNRMSSVEGDISTLNQTTQSFATRIENAEGSISTLTQTAEGLQNRVADAEGNISSVTQLATGMQTRLTSAEGSINTLTQTASSLESTIGGIVDRRNLLSSVEEGRLNVVTGAEIDSEDYVRSEFIEVESQEDYRTSINGSSLKVSYFIEYDKDKKFIRNASNTSLVNTASNTKYVRFYFMKNVGDYKKLQFEKGSDVSSYIPFISDVSQSQITQLNDNINLRVIKGETIAQINLEAETGTVYIGGKAVILDGDTTVTGTFKVKDANITSVDAGKMTTGTLDAGRVNVININANNITSGTIDANLLTIRGGSSTDYTLINGSYLESRGRYRRTWLGITTTHDVSTRHENGYIRMRNNSADHSLYFSDFGFSTYIDGEGPQGGSSGSLLWWDRTYSPSNANGITLNSYGGVAALTSDRSHVVLDSQQSVKIMSRNSSVFIKPTTGRQRYNQTFNFTTAVGSGYGYMMYGDEDTGIWRSGFRFSHGSGPTIHLVDENFSAGGDTTLDSGRVWTNDIRKRGGTGNGVYWNGTSGGTLNDGANPGNTLSASGIITNRGDRDMHLGTRTGSVRVTNDFGYNNGNGITYRPIVASAFTQASSIKYKTNIEEVDNVALDIINALTVVEYNLKDDLDNGVYDRQVGLIAENSRSVAVEDNTAIGLYRLTSYNTKAIQELDEKQNLAREELIMKIAKLELRIIELESVA